MSLKRQYVDCWSRVIADQIAGKPKERWSSQVTFLLAAMGCTIGLGNIWRFPFVAGEGGGGAFLIIYVAALLLIAIPVMMAELYLGHRGRGDPASAIDAVSKDAKRSPLWAWSGHLMAALGLIYLFYYPVIGSWALHYTALAATGGLEEPERDFTATYSMLQSDGMRMTVLHTIFLPLAAFVTALGIRAGLESLAKYVIPLLLTLLLALLVYAGFTLGLGQGIAFLFTPDFGAVTPAVVLSAIGQALFSTAVGQGVLLVYAGHLYGKVNIATYSLTICLADATVAIAAGIFVFSVVFAYNLTPAAGEGLVYIALPQAFADMPYGSVVATAFFGMLAVAAFTSVVPTIELLARWLNGHSRLSHRQGALVVGAISWLGGLLVIRSQIMGEDGPGLLRIFDYLVSNLMIPIAVLTMAVFVSWKLDVRIVASAIGLRNSFGTTIFVICLRFVAPAAIATVFIANV